jgi:hypothetical protein
MRTLTSPYAKRISSPRKFRSSPQKDFCNNIGQKQDILIASADVRFDPESGHANENASERIDQEVRASLHARPREIRTPGICRCELLLCRLTFLNYTKMTKYEALEKNAVSSPRMT